MAGIAALALVLALLTFEDDPPQDRSAPWDIVAVTLAGDGCAAAFYGASQLQNAGPGPSSLVPLIVGVVMLAALLVHQYRARHPLMPVRQLATTFPAYGILIAMTASASAFGLMELVLTALQKKSTPLAIALQFLPEFGAAVITAVLFAFLFRTRFTPVLAVGGLAVVAAAAALLTGLASGGGTLVAAGCGLIGLGVGASVSPALLITGFSLRSAQIQRVFAFLELIRGVTAFLMAPILLYLATVIGTSTAAGTQAAIWVCLAIAAGGVLTTLVVFVLSAERLQAPDLETWTHGEPAWDSTPLLSRLRSKKSETKVGNMRQLWHAAPVRIRVGLYKCRFAI